MSNKPSKVLIIGSGPVGIIHAQLASNQGAADIYIADIVPAKLQQARSICGDILAGTLDNSDSEKFIKQVRQISSGMGFDQIMICCSAPVAGPVTCPSNSSWTRSGPINTS